jgi:Pyruvate/2-oxoacid:ferredoxin oxidoreductase delta subunit
LQHGTMAAELPKYCPSTALMGWYTPTKKLQMYYCKGSTVCSLGNKP